MHIKTIKQFSLVLINTLWLAMNSSVCVPFVTVYATIVNRWNEWLGNSANIKEANRLKSYIRRSLTLHNFWFLLIDFSHE